MHRTLCGYYEILERTQKGTLDVTPWMEWFLTCLGRAIGGAQTTLAVVLNKARFWQAVHDVSINDRQRLVLNRMLDGFQGKLTTSKWAKSTPLGWACRWGRGELVKEALCSGGPSRTSDPSSGR